MGTNLVESLRHRFEVRSLDQSAPLNGGHTDLWRQCDLLDSRALKEELKLFRPDIVLHFGARTDLHGRDLEDYSANTTGVRNLIDAVAELESPAHTVYASSRLVFAIDHDPVHDYDYRPSTVYGESKIRGEEIVRAHGGEAGTWTIVRPTSIWGPWFAAPYRDFFDSVRRGRYVTFPGSNPTKSFGYVGNLVHEVERIFSADVRSVDQKVFWLTDYPPIDVNRWAELISAEFGVRAPRRAPLWLVKGAAKAGDFAQRVGLVRDPAITSFRLANLLADRVYDTRTLQELVGTLPYSVSDGVKATVDWIRQRETGYGRSTSENAEPPPSLFPEGRA